jgi:hypothetical protein
MTGAAARERFVKPDPLRQNSPNRANERPRTSP